MTFKEWMGSWGLAVGFFGGLGYGGMKVEEAQKAADAQYGTHQEPIGRYAIDPETGEITIVPDGTVEVSNHVVDNLPAVEYAFAGAFAGTISFWIAAQLLTMLVRGGRRG